MYEETPAAVEDALQGSSTAVFTDATIDIILDLTTGTGDTAVRIDQLVPDANGNVTVAAGAEIVMIKTSDTVQTTITPPLNAPVIIFQGAGGVIATINDGVDTVVSAAGVVDRVVVGTAGADRIVIADAENSLVTIGQGDTVVAGAGSDTIVAGTGNATVAGGTGHAIVQMTGAPANYTVAVGASGHAVVTNTSSGVTTDITKIQFVQLGSGEALVFARNSIEAAVTTLYETTFGRTADANGLDYWFDLARAGHSLSAIAAGFTGSAEYASMAATTNDQFVQQMYTNAFGRTADAGGLAFWSNALNSGGLTRAALVATFSEQVSHIIDHTSTTETTIVGNITIVTGIA